MTDLPICEKLRDRGYPTHVFGGPCIPGELVNPDGPEAADLFEELYEALKALRGNIGCASLVRNPIGQKLRADADAILAKVRGSLPHPEKEGRNDAAE